MGIITLITAAAFTGLVLYAHPPTQARVGSTVTTDPTIGRTTTRVETQIETTTQSAMPSTTTVTATATETSTATEVSTDTSTLTKTTTAYETSTVTTTSVSTVYSEVSGSNYEDCIYTSCYIIMSVGGQGVGFVPGSMEHNANAPSGTKINVNDTFFFVDQAGGMVPVSGLPFNSTVGNMASNVVTNAQGQYITNFTIPCSAQVGSTFSFTSFPVEVPGVNVSPWTPGSGGGVFITVNSTGSAC